MPLQIQVALISAVISLVLGAISGYFAFQREKRKWLTDIKTAYQVELHKTRIASYPVVFKIIGKLSHHASVKVTPQIAKQVATELNDWFYSDGGMCAGARARGAIRGLRGACEDWEKKMKEPPENFKEWLKTFYGWRNFALFFLRLDLDIPGLESFEFENKQPELREMQKELNELNRSWISKTVRSLMKADKSPQVRTPRELEYPEYGNYTHPIEIGDDLAASGHYDESLAAYEQILQLDPNNIAICHHKGNVLVQLKRYNEALTAYEQVLRLDPKNAHVWKEKGDVLRELHRYNEALTTYEQVLQLDPTNAYVSSSKGDVLRELHHYDRALAAYQQAIHSDRYNIVGSKEKATLLRELHRDREAITAFTDLADKLEKARFYDKEALDAYDQILQLDPDNISAYQHKGDVLTSLKRHTEALSAYEQALRLDPDNISAYQHKGDVLTSLKRYTEALSAYEQALRLDPNNTIAYHHKEDVLLQLKRFEDDLSACDQVIHNDPGNPDAHRNKGDILLKLERYKEALAAYEYAIHLKPDSAVNYHRKGFVLQRLGKLQEAQQAYQKARELGY